MGDGGVGWGGATNVVIFVSPYSSRFVDAGKWAGIDFGIAFLASKIAFSPKHIKRYILTKNKI